MGGVSIPVAGSREKDAKGSDLDPEDPFVGTSPRAKTMPLRTSLLRDTG
jgi:hypothetical protein